MHDFDFCFVVEDFGAKSDSFSYTIDIFLMAFITFSYSFKGVNVLLGLHLLFAINKILDIISNFPFYALSISRLNFSLAFSYFFLILLIALSIVSSLNTIADVPVILIFSITFTFKSGIFYG